MEKATAEETEKPENIHLNLPHAGKQGQLLMRKLSKNILTKIKGRVQRRTTYNARIEIQCENQTKLIHRHNVTPLAEITRTDTFKGDEAQTSIPAEPKDRRQWIGLP